MQHRNKAGVANSLIISFVALMAIAAAEVLCALFAPAGVMLPVSVASLAVIGLICVYAFGVMKKKVFRRLEELGATAADIAAGDFKPSTPVYEENDVIGYLSRSLASLNKNAGQFNRIIHKIADGDLEAETDEGTEKGRMAKGFDAAVSSLNKLAGDVDALSKAIIEGKTEMRLDPSGYRGAYGVIVRDLNETFDAIFAPINEAEDVLKRMSLNDYSKKMPDDYKGSMKEMAACINDVHGRLLSILDVMQKLARGDTSRLEELKAVGRRSEHDNLIPAIVKTLETIRSLIEETGTLAKAAYEGALNVRGDENKFEGAYREIIGGLNRTMEAVAEPIMECAEVMQEVASGNLTVEMNGEYTGEYVRIKDAINHTLRSFNGILKDISVASAQVSAGAKQVSESSVALSQGATEQASSVEELTASIEEIAVQTKQNANDADQANKLAESAKEFAEKGNEQMKAMLDSMEEINVSSDNISKIIKVIDDIAFQTNILALNAAVEAARAGQHGKGFTVVAEEVRNLAARSAKAANETTELIKNSMSNVEKGTLIANETAKALGEIVTGVTEAAQLVHNISLASNEQSAAIEQVNQGIMQVSQVVQSNSATSEEGAAASEELASQAEVLREQIEKFRLKEEARYEGLDEETIKRMEKLFEKNYAAPEMPPKQPVPAEKETVISGNKY